MAAFPTLFTLARLVGGVALPGWCGDAPRPTPTRKRGRPRTSPREAARRAAAYTTLVGGPLRGRPPRYDRQAIVRWVDTHKAETGGRYDATALREGIVEALKTRDPAKHRRLEERRHYYLDDGCTPARALRQAVLDVEGAHFKTLTVLLSQARRRGR